MAVPGFFEQLRYKTRNYKRGISNEQVCIVVAVLCRRTSSQNPSAFLFFCDGFVLRIDTDHTILRSKTATFLLKNLTAVTFFICHGFGVPRVLIGVLPFDMIRQKTKYG